MGNLSLKNPLDVSWSAALRCLRDERANLSGEGKVGFVGHGENVRDLGSNNFFGYAFAAFEADPLGGDGLQAAAIVQPVGFRVPKNGVDIEKIVPQELLDGMRLGSPGHVGVIFHPPEIEDQAIGTKPALRAAESIR